MSVEPTLKHFARVGVATVRRGAVALGGAWHALSTDIRSEWVMGMNRLMAGFLMLGATAASVGAGRGDLTFPHWWAAIGIWLALGSLLFVHMLAWPRRHALRRGFAMGLDVAGASIVLHASGAAAAFVYPVYLWIILGNGLRFGGRYLLTASMLSILGFVLVIATTPFWRAEPRLTAGLMAGLVVLPAYSYVLVRRLASARTAAEQASRAKTLFLAGVSHELRTPLNAITGMTDILQSTILDGDQTSMVATINVSADALLSMIEGLLDVSRIEAGQLRLSPVEFDLAHLLADVHRIIGVQAAARNLWLNTFITVRTPLSLRGDAARLREVFLSLCANAVKFTAAGSITVAVDGEAGADGRVRLRAEVTDTGIGIEPASQARIFDMFTQADESIATRFGGTGMGLAICDRLVRLLGGVLGVTSEPLHGSTFWFTAWMESGPEPDEAPVLDEPVRILARDPQRAAALTARLKACGIDAQLSWHGVVTGASRTPSLAFVDPGDDSAVTQAASDARVTVLVRPLPNNGLPPPRIRERYATAVDLSSSDASLRRAVRIVAAQVAATSPRVVAPRAARLGPSGMHVLVADDNAVNRRVVTRILEHAGHEVVTVHDGEQALDVLASGAVDIAILDVNMPLLSGIETARLHLFSARPEIRVPILGLTADGTPETAAQCLAAGMAACLVKPLRSAALLDALDKVLASRERDQTGRRPMTPRPISTESTPPLDLQALADLAEVGGEAFVAGVVRDFIEDTERIIAQLQAALMADDLTKFRAQAHALCSSATNVGARGLRELCYPWQTLSAAEMDETGPALLQLLRGEWARARAAFLERAG